VPSIKLTSLYRSYKILGTTLFEFRDGKKKIGTRPLAFQSLWGTLCSREYTLDHSQITNGSI